jgi:hypothetical protein
MITIKNISKFSNIQDYLSIFTSALIVDLFVIFLSIIGFIKSKTLKEWYHKYQVSAVIADVLSIFIGIISARIIYSIFFKEYNLLYFIIVAVLFQLFHDLCFALFFNSIPRGKSKILDTFKDYANELGPTILLADASMIIGTIILAGILSNFDFNINLFVMIISLYIMPYFLYTV